MRIGTWNMALSRVEKLASAPEPLSVAVHCWPEHETFCELQAVSGRRSSRPVAVPTRVRVVRRCGFDMPAA